MGEDKKDQSTITQNNSSILDVISQQNEGSHVWDIHGLLYQQN